MVCALCFSELVTYQWVRREYSEDNPFSTKESNNTDRDRNKIEVPCPICAKSATYNLRLSVMECPHVVDLNELRRIEACCPKECCEEEEKFEADLDLTISLYDYLEGL